MKILSAYLVNRFYHTYTLMYGSQQGSLAAKCSLQKAVFLLQVMQESVLVLQVTRESVSAATSHVCASGRAMKLKIHMIKSLSP